MLGEGVQELDIESAVTARHSGAALEREPDSVERAVWFAHGSR